MWYWGLIRNSRNITILWGKTVILFFKPKKYEGGMNKNKPNFLQVHCFSWGFRGRFIAFYCMYYHLFSSLFWLATLHNTLHNIFILLKIVLSSKCALLNKLVVTSSRFWNVSYEDLEEEAQVVLYTVINPKTLRT